MFIKDEPERKRSRWQPIDREFSTEYTREYKAEDRHDRDRNGHHTHSKDGYRNLPNHSTRNMWCPEDQARDRPNTHPFLGKGTDDAHQEQTVADLRPPSTMSRRNDNTRPPATMGRPNNNNRPPSTMSKPNDNNRPPSTMVRPNDNNRPPSTMGKPYGQNMSPATLGRHHKESNQTLNLRTQGKCFLCQKPNLFSFITLYVLVWIIIILIY